MARSKRSPAQKQKSATRRKSALQLHVEGHTFEAIGQRLGVSRQRAHQLVTEELAEAAKERGALASKALDADLERVDFVLRSLAPKVAQGNDKAASAYLRAMERRAKLLGLDAPDRSEVSGPDGSPIALDTDPAALAARLAASVARAAREPDPGADREDGSEGAG